mmetsp:Transcript_10304/g.13495  ORF Transcript_10304/g.13495 Transcript_10304/m.13495 type:complete len:85 (-) Transcript_10304:600-854(-)
MLSTGGVVGSKLGAVLGVTVGVSDAVGVKDTLGSAVGEDVEVGAKLGAVGIDEVVGCGDIVGVEDGVKERMSTYVKGWKASAAP